MLSLRYSVNDSEIFKKIMKAGRHVLAALQWINLSKLKYIQKALILTLQYWNMVQIENICEI